MKAIRTLTAAGIFLGLAACGGTDLASRNETLIGSAPAQSAEFDVASASAARRVILSSQYNVTEVNISVPQTLAVSEANMFYPIADIVWRGEPRGDRHAQVGAIFTEAFGLGTGQMKAGPAVIVDAQVERFHSLTEKTRYTVGGMHSLRFMLTVRDAATKAIIDGPRLVVADIKAAGGSRAIAEDQAGRTQRVVIIEQLSSVIRRELSRQREDFPVSRNSLEVPLTPARVMQQTPIPL